MAKTNNPDSTVPPNPSVPSGSSVSSGIVAQHPARAAQRAVVASLKGNTDVRLRPENDQRFQTMMAKINSDSVDPNKEYLDRLTRLDLMANKVELTQSMPSFRTHYDSPVHIGEQKFGNREEVAHAVDKLSGITEIATGRVQPTQDYKIDFTGLPLKSFSSPTPTGNWNKVSSQPVKVGKNFALDGSFEQAFQIVLASEGGFANHKADKGGATIYGIASRSNPKEYQKIMDQLSRGDTAGAMQTTMMTYKSKYWDAVPGIENMSASARLVAFDAAVNHGVGFAKTMVNKTHGDTDAMISYRAQKYAAIIQNDPSQAIFEKGWGNRLAKLETLTDTSERNSSVTVASKERLPEPVPVPAPAPA